MQHSVYADNAATTKISEKVLAAMMPYLTEQYGNASSIYSLGRQSKKAVELAREQVASSIGAKPAEIYFTAGGSESDNWAIKGVCAQLKKLHKNHIISSTFEHHAVLHTLQSLEKQGWEVTYVPVGEDGIVDPADVEKAIREDTALVTIMYANNEIGTIQPIAEIGAVCRNHSVVFHTDAVQAVGNIPIDVVAENIDMLSISGHKLHGPKGIGALYIRKGIRIPSYIDGGAQERGLRAGTENVAGIVGLGTAIEEANNIMEARTKRLSALRDKVIAQALTIPRSRLNGDPVKRLPGNVNLSFEGIEGESLLLLLDAKGIAASSGSACTSGSLDPSHVLLAIGLVHDVAHGSLRLSFSDDNTEEEIDYILEQLPPIVERLRAMSPLWEKIEKGEDINSGCGMEKKEESR